MSLKGGQVVKYAGDLYRIDFINACRMRLVPLSKKQISLSDDGSLNSSVRGISVSAGACIEVVSDLERARDEMELLAAERELAAAKSELRQEATLRDELADAEAELDAIRRAVGAPQNAPESRPGQTVRSFDSRAPSNSGPPGWYPGPVAWPFLAPGTAASTIRDYIVSNPGKRTIEIVAALDVNDKTIAAYVFKFKTAGYIHKKSA